MVHLLSGLALLRLGSLNLVGLPQVNNAFILLVCYLLLTPMDIIGRLAPPAGDPHRVIIVVELWEELAVLVDW